MSGRTRHILVDTTGLLLRVVVHPADIADRDGAPLVLAPVAERFPRLVKLWADAGSQGRCARWITDTLGWRVEIVRTPRRWLWWPADPEPPPMPAGVQVLPWHWVVERTVAWLGRNRRLSTDDAVLPTTEAAWSSLAMVRRMVARLAR